MDIPGNWKLIEEHEGCSVFENIDKSFNVYIDFKEQAKMPYTISYEQMEGDYELIDYEDGNFTASALTAAEALQKAVQLMNFIDIKMNGTSEEADNLMS